MIRRLSLIFLPALALAASPSALADQRTGVAGIAAGETYAAARARLAADYDRTIAELERITETPAPPFKEDKRAALFAALLREAGLKEVEIDPEGNVTALRPGLGDGAVLRRHAGAGWAG